MNLIEKNIIFFLQLNTLSQTFKIILTLHHFKSWWLLKILRLKSLFNSPEVTLLQPCCLRQISALLGFSVTSQLYFYSVPRIGFQNIVKFFVKNSHDYVEWTGQSMSLKVRIWIRESWTITRKLRKENRSLNSSRKWRKIIWSKLIEYFLD